jgi:hypothetical protein
LERIFFQIFGNNEHWRARPPSFAPDEVKACLLKFERSGMRNGYFDGKRLQERLYSIKGAFVSFLPKCYDRKKMRSTFAAILSFVPFSTM